MLQGVGDVLFEVGQVVRHPSSAQPGGCPQIETVHSECKWPKVRADKLSITSEGIARGFARAQGESRSVDFERAGERAWESSGRECSHTVSQIEWGCSSEVPMLARNCLLKSPLSLL